MRRLLRFLRGEDGATAVEYAVGLAFIVLAVALVVGVLGNYAGQTFQSVGNTVGTYGG